MSSPLEKFVLENREKFDAETPDPRVWEKITERIESGIRKGKHLFVPCLLNAGWPLLQQSCWQVYGRPYFITASARIKPTEVAETNPAHLDSSNHLPVMNTPVDTSKQIAQK